MRFKLLPLLAVLAPVMHARHAHAEGEVTFSVVDHGDSVEVIAHNLTIKNTNVSQIRSRLEVPLVGNPSASRQTSPDTTVMQVELDGFALSVKTRLDKPEVHELAKLAHAEQVGSDVHLIFPRHAQLAQPAQPAQPQPAAAPVKAAEPPKAEAPKLEAPAPIPAKVDATPAAAPVAKVEIPVEKKPEPQKLGTPIPPEKRDWSGTGFYAIAALGALGGAAYFMKKKQKAAATQTSTIDVIAQRTLGNKAKVVWLAAGQREMIVSVTGTQVRVLGQWPRGTANAPAVETNDGPRLPRLPTATAVDTTPERPSLSPSVAGILKLRAQTQNNLPIVGRTPTAQRMPTIEPLPDLDDNRGEPDLAWAKEILAATGRR
ncbi:MAG TPA: flagellar biosynthetic protein FliO [Kofleriaceae bacterium]|jgi:flagellar biogenesis protein FliO|nr:flagellar biosynthetic protein FliO [Kofleriaceae bacterium]